MAKVLPHHKFAYECLRIGRALHDAGHDAQREDFIEKGWELKKAAVFLLGFPNECPYVDDSLKEPKEVEEEDEVDDEPVSRAPWPLTWFFK
jgi:hypothetical protein